MFFFIDADQKIVQRSITIIIAFSVNNRRTLVRTGVWQGTNEDMFWRDKAVDIKDLKHFMTCLFTLKKKKICVRFQTKPKPRKIQKRKQKQIVCGQHKKSVSTKTLSIWQKQ